MPAQPVLLTAVATLPRAHGLLAYVYPYVHTRYGNNNNNRRLVTLAEHTSDHGKQTNSSTKENGAKLYIICIIDNYYRICVFMYYLLLAFGWFEAFRVMVAFYYYHYQRCFSSQ